MGRSTPMAQSSNTKKQNSHFCWRSLWQYPYSNKQRPHPHLSSQQIKVTVKTNVSLSPKVSIACLNDWSINSHFRWDNRTSVVIPEEHIFYLVAFLTSAVPSSTGTDGLEHILTQNKRILEFCETAHLGVKQYLPHYTTKKEWQAHFGPRWEAFVQRKSAYDPLAILAPGQRIFQKAIPFSWQLPRAILQKKRP